VLPPQVRLRRRRCFPLVYQQGRRLTSSCLVLYWIPVPQGEVQQGKWAVVVSKKVSRQAVVRNRIKRQLRAALGICLPQLSSGYWGIVIARASILKANWQQICAELTALLQEAGLFTSFQ